MTLHILILDEAYTCFVDKSSYADYITESDNVKLLMISNYGHIPIEDQHRYLEYAELKRPTNNGQMELIAARFHEKHRIDVVYTSAEELILRAAGIRKLLGISGMWPKDAILFREKGNHINNQVLMKEACAMKNLPLPPFNRALLPTDVLEFVRDNNFPVIIKPTLSCAAAGIKILNNKEELETYLENDFYAGINEQTLDLPGNMIIEKFISAPMYHVNGFAKNGKIKYCWPFAYKSNNLDFAGKEGVSYGNVSITSQDSRFTHLIASTQNILNCLQCPENLVFHCELFQGVTEREYLLCEIAARKPGASICLLIDLIENGAGKFSEIEFRLNVGLEPRQKLNGTVDGSLSEKCVGDLLIRRPVGKLMRLPDPETCPVKNLQCIPMAKLESVYRGYDVNIVNTSMRMVATTASSPTGTEEILQSLTLGSDWYNANLVFTAQ